MRTFNAQHRWSAFEANKMIETLIMYITRLGEINQGFISILNINPCLKYLPTGYLYLFMLSVLILWPFMLRKMRNRHDQIFFLTLICGLKRPANQNNH